MKKLTKPLGSLLLAVFVFFGVVYITQKPPRDVRRFPKRVAKNIGGSLSLVAVDEDVEEDRNCEYVVVYPSFLMYTTNGGIIFPSSIREGDIIWVVAESHGGAANCDDEGNSYIYLYEPYWLLYQSPEA